MLKVSIITPSFNQASYLETNLKSIAQQDYPHIEHIVIDGGSTDESVNVLQEHTDQLAYWESKPDEGQSDAINKGFRKATGNIITWINSDDTLLPGAISDVVSNFEKRQDLGILIGRTKVILKNGDEIVKGVEEHEWFEQCLAGMPYPQPGAFFARKLIDEQGMLDESFHFGMDYDLFIRAFLNYPAYRTEALYATYLIHDESKTGQNDIAFAHDWIRTYQKFLRSVDNGDSIIDQLQRLGLKDSGVDKYRVTIKVSEEQLNRTLFYFLRNMVFFYYEGLDLKTTGRLLNYLDEHYPIDYAQHKLNRIHQKIRFLPKPIIALARNIKR